MAAKKKAVRDIGAKATKKTKGPPPTSSDLDSIQVELRHAGNRSEIVQTCTQIAKHLRTLDLPDHYWKFIELGRAPKKNFAQAFSTALAQKIANALRPRFPGILPDVRGGGHESKSRAASGSKKLDVNFSTQSAGLELAVSVKTINFLDEKTGRYTKNIRRADGELRAEAQDCHKRQPYAVLAGLIFLPRESALDGVDGGSSLHHAWHVYYRRAGRKATDADPSTFEQVYVGLYESEGEKAGTVVFFDVEDEPPARGVPEKTLSFREVLKRIEKAYRDRNRR